MLDETSPAAKDHAAAHGIALLYSPPYYPQCNAAVEAGIGQLETHMLWAAARHDRPTAWSCDDVYAAQVRADAVSDTATGLTRLERWRDRDRITTDERRPPPADREALS